ncbi:DUF2799 domain-containing protein [Vibrio sp. YMD68]|uniref:DUF2799 domain-containing protein n=1 Tax=Vibrio sp. YMD68 TaxID=3042300 RepID=UPI002499D0C6|nr:DUF2799 domain-containing protein [Vibrio sp. YMD68]WGW00651.1 DUF2799 domain-containing protein [Vibrio sp. YMD68]
MKYLYLLVVLFMVGCAQVQTPDSYAVNDWAEFGKQRAIDGQLYDSQSRLNKLDEKGVLNDNLYMAYDKGYQEGKAEYCAQDARMLGVSGKPYRGICDDVNVFFRADYDSGRESGSLM